jgi:hypothetical protein
MSRYNSAEIRRRSALMDELCELDYDEDKLEAMSTEELQAAFDEAQDEDSDVTLGIDEDDDLVDFTFEDGDDDEEF